MNYVTAFAVRAAIAAILVITAAALAFTGLGSETWGWFLLVGFLALPSWDGDAAREDREGRK